MSETARRADAGAPSPPGAAAGGRAIAARSQRLGDSASRASGNQGVSADAAARAAAARRSCGSTGQAVAAARAASYYSTASESASATSGTAAATHIISDAIFQQMATTAEGAPQVKLQRTSSTSPQQDISYAAPRGGGARAPVGGMRQMVVDAREALSIARPAPSPVGELGGCEQAGVLLTLAKMSPGPGGCISDDDSKAAHRLVDAAKGRLLKSALLAALFLLIMYAFAYDREGEALSHLSGISDRMSSAARGIGPHPPGVLGPYDKARFVNLERFIPLAGTGDGVEDAPADAPDAAASAALSAQGGFEALKSTGAAVLGRGPPVWEPHGPRGRVLMEGIGEHFATGQGVDDHTLPVRGRLLASRVRGAPPKFSDLASFLADIACVFAAMAALLLSLAMYSHLSFWMPSLEAQLWYVGASSPTWAWVDIARKVAVVCCLLSLAFECAVTGSWWTLLAFLPLAGALLAALYVRRTLSRDCELYLNAEIDTRAWEKKKHGSHVSSMVQDAREALSQRLRSANPVGELGGCEQTAALLSLAKMEPGEEGGMSAADTDAAHRLIDSAKAHFWNNSFYPALACGDISLLCLP